MTGANCASIVPFFLHQMPSMSPHLAHFSAMIAQLGKGFRKLGYVCGIAGYRAAALDTTFQF